MVELSGSKASTNLQRHATTSSNREGERAHKLAVLYSANNIPADASPFLKEVLAKALTRLTILLVSVVVRLSYYADY